MTEERWVQAPKEPTVAEIQERHDVSEQIGVPKASHTLQVVHNDRGILLKRLEAVEQKIKRLGYYATHKENCAGKGLDVVGEDCTCGLQAILEDKK